MNSTPQISAGSGPSASTEMERIASLLGTGRLSGGASVVCDYEEALSAYFRVPRVIAVNSGSSALHAALVALGARANTEVLVPAIAPLPTVFPVLTSGARPVIVDTAPGRLSFDPDDLARKVTDRTRVAISVPMWGYPVEDSEQIELLRDAGIRVIEDACQAHLTVDGGQLSGTRADIGCFSTHDRKVLSTGEGGFLVAGDPEILERLDFYTHLGHLKGGHGVNYKLAGPLAAIGLARLPGMVGEVSARRERAAQFLMRISRVKWLSELEHQADSAPNYYSLVLLIQESMRAVADNIFSGFGVQSDSKAWNFHPLNERPIFEHERWVCPNARSLATHTMQLPVHSGLPWSALDALATELTAVTGAS